MGSLMAGWDSHVRDPKAGNLTIPSPITLLSLYFRGLIFRSSFFFLYIDGIF